MPDLISDGGSMTIGRRTASWTYGSFEVTLPEGDQQPDDDGRLADAYIYRPDDRETGRFDLTFVRADVRIDMNAHRSDLETTLDQASRRTAGDTFYTRELTGPSLGRKRPGVDYDVGDVLDVMVWGQIMRLPVTQLRAISTPQTPLGWAVRVGGQALADPEALRKRTSDLEAQIAAEKRQRLSQHERQQNINIQAAQNTADAAQAAADAVTAQQELAEVTQAEQFVLHDNQLKWLSWSKHFYDFVFSPESGATTRVGRSIDTGLVDIRVNTQSGMGVEVIIRPGWRGRWRLDWTQVGGTDTGDLSGWEAGTRTNATSTAYQTDKIIRRVELSVWPEHSSAPREWVVRVASGADGGSTFVAPELTMGTLTISGAPVQQPAGAVRFSTPVVAARDVTANGLLYPSGTTIPLGTDIRPVANETAGLILFTEVKPPTTWEPGAPLSGRQILPIASQTIPRSTWVTLAEWTGLAWSTARTATIELIVQWAKYNSWALADYYIRITRNGTQIGYLARGTTGGMDTHFKIKLTGQTLRAGDVLRFEARATPGYASERKIASASADITWT